MIDTVVPDDQLSEHERAWFPHPYLIPLCPVIFLGGGIQIYQPYVNVLWIVWGLHDRAFASSFTALPYLLER